MLACRTGSLGRGRRIAFLLSLLLVFTAVAGGPAAAASRVHAPAPQKVAIVPHSTLTPRKPAFPATPKNKVADTAWPAAGSGVADLSAAAGASTGAGVAAGVLPVEVRRAGGAAGTRTVQGTALAATAAQPVSVSVLSRTQAAAANVSGVLMTVGSAGANAPGAVSLSLDYSSFQNAGGAGFADRLHLVELPACAVTTPDVAACQIQTPIASTDDAKTHRLSATLSLPASGPAAGTASGDAAGTASRLRAATAVPHGVTVFAAVAGASGSNGDFTATPLSPSGTWSHGGATGDFTWSYPLTVPKPAAGKAPQVGLDYDSADVDGRVASTNNQFGMVGEGFTLTSNYIGRAYTDCADDPEGAIANDYDNCWAGQVVTMSLNGQSTPLFVDSSGVWHEEQDSGDRIQYLTGTSTDTANGTYDNGYWLVTAPDGTQYYFGKNRGPGWATGDPSTNSTWTEPVYGAHSGDPCYDSAGFSHSSCSQAWQWNLDFVVDPNGNSTIYSYTAEQNYYGADNATTGVVYDRAGFPTKIQYGLREENGSVYSGTAAEQVAFTTAQRCIPTSSFTCDPSQFTAANASYWPDTPQDQQCLSGATCNNHAPTFWSMMRVTDITTSYYNGSSYTKVDDYQLAQGFSTAGDNELLLNSITHTGYGSSGASLTLSPENFTYQLMDNRVPGYNSEPSMAHWRLTNIETETGEIVSVTYNQECSLSTIPSDPSQNTGLCYPIYWTPLGDSNQILDYFDKYVVDQVEVQDGTADDPSQFDDYTYVGGAAWHYDDNQLVKAKYRTYGQFRGYAEVDTFTGDTSHITNGTADAQTETKTYYYRGMNGDVLPGGGTRSVSVTDSLGESVTDDNAFADQVYETQNLDGVNGPEVSASITDLTIAATLASETVSGLPTLYSTMVRPSRERDYTDLAAGGTKVKTTSTTYDGFGRPILVDTSGTDIAEGCTQTTYADNTGAPWIRGAVDESITAAQSCPSGIGQLTTADILSDTRTFYDGSTTLGAAPTAGNATMESKAATDTGGTLGFVTQSTTAYDTMGRVVSKTDARGNATRTAYTPADGGPLTAQTTTNALNQTASETIDPGRGTLLSTTDASGYLTTATYDPLGRITAKWDPGRDQSTGASASVTYSYTLTDTAPQTITTNTLVDYGKGTDYVTSIDIYDALGQLRQTQTAAEGGNTVVGDTFYDSHGWQWETDNSYVISGGPSTTIASSTPSSINDRTITTFDADGRAVLKQDYNGTTLTASTKVAFDGGSVTTIEYDPNGNVVDAPNTVVDDVNGHKIETDQYTTAPTISGNTVTVAPGTKQATTLTYNAIGLETAVQDPLGHIWSYQYDLLGHQTSATDPDTGTTTTTYDADGDASSISSANGSVDNYVYDVLDRKTAEYTGSTTQGAGTKIGTWVYDTLKAGKLSYETSINPTTGVVYESGNLGYDSYGDTTGTWVVVPSSVTGLAGTYKTQYTYSSTGLKLTETPANAGGLPVDALTFSYDGFGNATGESGYDVYVSGAAWTPYSEISQINLGSGPSAATLGYSYDAQTRQETGVNLSDLQPSPQVDNTVYTYNAGGQMTGSTDTEGASGAAVETQCFTYDDLNRLTGAWSATDNCAADPFTTGSNATVNGPQPYAQSWSFNAAGDRTSETDLPPAGSNAGTTTTTYTYTTPGHANALTSTSSTNSATGHTTTNSYTYDGDGNTATRASGAETLSWNPNGKLTSDANASGTTGYVYDADGNLLIEADPASTTLYLPDEQITYTPATKALSGIRYYDFAGRTIAESNGTTLDWLEGNDQGTMSVAVNAFNQSSVTRRVFTPYGQPAANSQAWIDQKGFLGDTVQPATGLTDVGVRMYDSSIGAFISVDSNLNTDEPQSMNGYEYAGDNPVVNSDPSGAYYIFDGGGVVARSIVNYIDQVRHSLSLIEANPLLTAVNAADTIGGWAVTLTPAASNFNDFRQALKVRRKMLLKLGKQHVPDREDKILRKWGGAEQEVNDALDAGKVLAWTGRGLIVAGGVIGGFNEYASDTKDSTSGRVEKAVAAGAWDVGTGFAFGIGGELATAAIIGAGFGPFGTIAAVAGVLAVTGVASLLASNEAGQFADTVVGGARSAYHSISNVANTAANDIAHAFNPFSW